MPALTEKFGVSIRTIKRDIDELEYLIPLETKTGRYEGRVYVMKSYKNENNFLTVTLDVRVGIYNKHTAEKGGQRWTLRLSSKVTSRG